MTVYPTPLYTRPRPRGRASDWLSAGPEFRRARPRLFPGPREAAHKLADDELVALVEAFGRPWRRAVVVGFDEADDELHRALIAHRRAVDELLRRPSILVIRRLRPFSFTATFSSSAAFRAAANLCERYYPDPPRLSRTNAG